MMTDDNSIRELSMHPLHQFTQGFHLLWCPRVSCLARRVQTAFVADTDAMPVMPYAVSTHPFEATARIDVPSLDTQKW